MERNLNNIITFNNFYEMFLKFYNDDTYKKVLEESNYYNNKIKDKMNYNDLILSPKRKLRMVSEKLRTRSNEDSFYKLLVIINSIFDQDTFHNLLESHFINTSFFTESLNNFILFNKITKKDLILEDGYLKDTLDLIEKYYSLNNYQLYIFKLYEIEALKKIELTKQKTK